MDTPDDAAVGWTVHVTPITDEHRAIPGVMFGGWGPHLGHLVQTQDASYWVDDVCSRAVLGDCNVDVNRRVGVFRHAQGGWQRVATIPLGGVQQNTATIADGDRLRIYGIASGAQRVIECTYELVGGATSCTTIAIPTGAGANYVGAAVVGTSRIVWWTNVVNGGGGSFSYIVDYGGGWNGPRTGAIGGYNDCAYTHAGTRPDGTLDTFCQVVSGNAPNWTFATLVGTAPAGLDAPVAWSNGLAAPALDPIISTNDLLVDVAGTAHLLARSSNGAAIYYAKPAMGAYARIVDLPATYRARWLVDGDRVALARDVGRSQLVVSISPPAPTELVIAEWETVVVDLPEGFGDILAIYPLAPAYQRSPVTALQLVVVGSTDEQLALHVAIE
ncbi:MAG: hypothetical protein ACKV2T_43175 [Kofleriaceae bacterium]